MRYGSVCSGIEAATVAWEPLGWKPAFFSEIDPFCCDLLVHRYGSNLLGEAHASNGVPNFGDMNNHKEWPDANIDVLVGGTPCQAFSIAGLRKGLDDPRGNLTLTYLAVVDRSCPEWVVWENVPGVLSIDGGRAFSAFITGLAKCGYGWAYRVLDAQYIRVDGHARAVPQRRRRVFVVGHSSGDFRRAASILFEQESLRGDPPPRREKGQGVVAHAGDGAEVCSGDVIVSSGAVSHCLNAGGMGRIDYETETIIAFPERMSATQYGAMQDVCGALGATNPHAVAYGIPGNWIGRKPENGGNAVEPMVECAPCLTKADRHGVAHGWAVRRLMPIECERLQGFPDGYTAIPRRNGKLAADAPRYKALGNSMATNVIRWIGQRIALAQEAV